MFKIGEIKRAKEIGYKGRCRYIWSACAGCGKERWVQLHDGKPKSLKCKSCVSLQGTGKNNSNWKGGRHKNNGGYIIIWIESTSPFFKMMSYKNYIKEHRLIMAQYLKRCLEKWEVVHHINEMKDDNRIENLELMTANEHNSVSHKRKKNNGKTRKISNGI